MSTFPLVLVFLTLTALSVSAVLAFWWAGKTGQFEQIEQGALSVFDADEVNDGKIQPEGGRGNPRF